MIFFSLIGMEMERLVGSNKRIWSSLEHIQLLQTKSNSQVKT